MHGSRCLVDTHGTFPFPRWRNKTEVREATCPESAGKHVAKLGYNSSVADSVGWLDTITQCCSLWVTSRDEDLNKWPS